ncbi:MAG: bifunctional 5,10-methylenetetrahydrofolate dehydrogenase/5,10-methenyltetrahydrofolate cyclohydrolase [Thermoplasmata archaeon]
MTERLDGKPVAEAIDASTRARVRDPPGAPVAPSLVSVHRGTESPFRFYLRRQARAAESVGVRFREESLAATDGGGELMARMASLDRDPTVHAVLLEHPLPPPFDFPRALGQLRPEKDVDGVGAANLGHLASQRPVHVPAVALAAIAIARHYRLPLSGERVAVIGRSATVGLPLAICLAGRSEGMDATVTIAHSRTPNLSEVLAGSKTIFSCVGRPGLLDRTVVPRDAYVIDVGLSSVPDASAKGGVRPAGDVNAASLDGWAAGFTPVPGGVGPVTVAELMASVVRARDLLRPGPGVA